jgi:hypothetical protein
LKNIFVKSWLGARFWGVSSEGAAIGCWLLAVGEQPKEAVGFWLLAVGEQPK